MTFTHEDPPIDGRRFRAADAGQSPRGTQPAEQAAPGQPPWLTVAQQSSPGPWPAANPWPAPPQQGDPGQAASLQARPHQAGYGERNFAPGEAQPDLPREERPFGSSAPFPAAEAPMPSLTQKPGEDTLSARQRRAMEAMRTAGTGSAGYLAPPAVVPPTPVQSADGGSHRSPVEPEASLGGAQFAAGASTPVAVPWVAPPSGPWAHQQDPSGPALSSQPPAAQPPAARLEATLPGPSAPEGYGAPPLSEYPPLPIADTARSPFPTASVPPLGPAPAQTGGERGFPVQRDPAAAAHFDPFSARRPSGQQPASGPDNPVRPLGGEPGMQSADETGPEDPLRTGLQSPLPPEARASAWPSSGALQTGPQAAQAWPNPGGQADRVAPAWQPPAYPSAPASPQPPSVVIADPPRAPFPVSDPTGQPVPAAAQDAPVALVGPPVPSRRALRQQRAAEQAPHWSEEVDHMTREPAGEALGGSPTASGPIAAHTLVVGARDHLTGPLSSTGEVILTGSIELPRTFAETGSHARLDNAELDEIEANSDPGTQQQPQQNSPVRASRAVGSQYETQGMVKPKGGMGSRLMSMLVIATAVVLVLVVIAVAVVVGPMLFG